MREKNPHAESPRVPARRSSAQGESAPKARLRSVVDGKQVNIPVLGDWSEVGTEKAKLANCWIGWFKRVGRATRQIRLFIILRRDDDSDLSGEVVDAKLPGKATKR